MGTFALAVCYVGAFVRPKTVQTACSMMTDFSSSCVFLGFFAFSLAFGYQYFISPPRERPRGMKPTKSKLSLTAAKAVI
jgi:hypothetical protein